MKTKMILAVLGLSLCMSAAAQRDNSGRDNNRRNRPTMDAVVDTAVLNKMGLDEKMMTDILALQAAQQEMMKEARPEKGKKMDDATRQALREKQAAFTADYRAKLRAIMGDKLYISYLEKQIDSRPTMRMQSRQRPVNMGGENRSGRMGGRNDGFGGGGMDGDF